MAVTLGFAALQGAIGMSEVIDLLEKAFAREAAGKTVVSPKFVTEFGTGAMRILFAADHDAGYCVTKAYHVINGAGVRYIVTLYRLADGELLALLDGRHITDLRTGGASGVAARQVPIPGAISIGVIGSGNQARTQLESLASVYRVESASVFSPTAANRDAFARDMSQKLGIRVKAIDTAEAAARGHAVVTAATSARSPEPVLLGRWLRECRLLCAVGNTRAQFAEVDVDCFRDAQLVVTDTPHALEEAGDLIQAVKAGALVDTRRTTLGALVTGKAEVPPEGLITFKSVGSALQDLALAARYYELLGKDAPHTTAPDLASVRPAKAG
jgi:alanine dehydrogenase